MRPEENPTLRTQRASTPETSLKETLEMIEEGMLAEAAEAEEGEEVAEEATEITMTTTSRIPTISITINSLITRMMMRETMTLSSMTTELSFPELRGRRKRSSTRSRMLLKLLPLQMFLKLQPLQMHLKQQLLLHKYKRSQRSKWKQRDRWKEKTEEEGSSTEEEEAEAEEIPEEERDSTTRTESTGMTDSTRTRGTSTEGTTSTRTEINPLRTEWRERELPRVLKARRRRDLSRSPDSRREEATRATTMRAEERETTSTEREATTSTDRTITRRAEMLRKSTRIPESSLTILRLRTLSRASSLGTSRTRDRRRGETE